MPERITIQVEVCRARSDLWRMWNAPEHIVCWNFASDDWHCPRAENDLRAGGRLCYRMEAKDGSFGFDYEAIYDQIIPDAKLEYTLTDGRRVETNFDDSGAGTRITTTFEAEQEHPADMQRLGWQALLDNFKRYAEAS